MTTHASLYPPDQPLGEAEVCRLLAYLGEPIEGGLAVMA